MKLKEWTAFLLLAVAWGSSFLFIKIGLQEIGPFTLVGYRLLFGALGLLVVVFFRRPPRPVSRRVWLALGIMGVVNTALPFVLISWGQQFIDSGVASILNGTVPLWAMLIGHFALSDERMNWRRVGGILTGFLGVILLVSGELGAGTATNAVLGQAAVLLSAVAYGGSSVFARLALREVSPIYQAFTTILVADVLVWLGVFVVEAPLAVPQLPLTWISVIWLGLLGSCLAYLLYFYLIQAVGPTRASMVTYLIPVLGVALGVTFLDERITFQLIGGSLLVGLGVWIVNR